MSPSPSGVGLGLRWELADAFEQRLPPLPFVEISPENYLGREGRYGRLLERALAHYPVLAHGLSLAVGGHERLDTTFLRQLRGFLDRLGATHYSDHLCTGWIDGVNLHDLLPVVRSGTEAARIADRVRAVQDALGRPFAVEHVSAYFEPEGCSMPEPEFLNELTERADCKLLLDVNNLDVNAMNFGFDAHDWLARAPLERAIQVHVAGPSWHELDADIENDGRTGLWLDTHGSAPRERVLELLAAALQRTGPLPVLLEWDTDIPPLDRLLDEVQRIQCVYDAALSTAPPQRRVAP